MYAVLHGLHQPMTEGKEDQGCKGPPQSGAGGFWLLADSLPYRAGGGFQPGGITYLMEDEAPRVSQAERLLMLPLRK